MVAPNLTDWTIVTVGHWNPQIFSTQWLSTNLHLENLEMLVAVGPPVGADFRYQTPTLLVIPGRQRLIIGARNTEDNTLNQMEEVSRTVLQLLGHTPVTALGINFGFTENDPPPELIQTFDLNDGGALSDTGHTVRAVEITRQIEMAPATLNLKMGLADGIVRFHFNFTHQISSAQEGADLLNRIVVTYRDRAMGMLTEVFHLHREEVTHNGN